MKSLVRQERQRAAAAATTVDIASYTRARLNRLDELIADPTSWAHIAAQALHVRARHPHGTPAWSTLTRLHHVALDLIRLHDEDPATHA